jgi:hypothetical protein
MSGAKDGVYRFYHQSMKVFYLQEMVRKALKLIEEIGGEEDPPSEWYCQIVKEGTEHDFNENVSGHSKPATFWNRARMRDRWSMSNSLKVPANNDLQFRRPRLVPTTDRTRAWDRSRDRRPVFAVRKTSHFDHRAGRSW